MSSRMRFLTTPPRVIKSFAAANKNHTTRHLSAVNKMAATTNSLGRYHSSSTPPPTGSSRYYSASAASLPGSSASSTHHATNDTAPQGDLFEHVGATADDENATTFNSAPSQEWVGKMGRIKRTFGAQANADAMLLCGGAALAAHASFDPQYQRAQGWIHNHAVGPAVLSPVLTSGLIHTLTEAAFPNSVPIAQSMQQIRPLIVGISVYATITVEKVTQNQLRNPTHTSYGKEDDDNDDAYFQQRGYQIDLAAVVSRVRDDVVISQGQVSIWLADLQHHHEDIDYVI